MGQEDAQGWSRALPLDAGSTGRTLHPRAGKRQAPVRVIVCIHSRDSPRRMGNNCKAQKRFKNQKKSEEKEKLSQSGLPKKEKPRDLPPRPFTRSHGALRFALGHAGQP